MYLVMRHHFLHLGSLQLELIEIIVNAFYHNHMCPMN
jgi:hypothetical protein